MEIKVTGMKAVDYLNKLNNTLMNDSVYVLGEDSEPFRVGDWVKVNNYPVDLNDSITIFKIEGENEDYYINKLKAGNGTGSVGYYKKDHCTKLTPEQIEILELE